MTEQLINSLSTLKNLKKLDLNSEHSYSTINSIIKDQVIIPYFKSTVHIGKVLYRARINDDKPFTLKSEISYKSDTNSIKYGRANRSRQSVFYAAHTEETAIFEVSKILRGINRVPVEYISIGVWYVIRPFDVFSIFSDEEFLRKNKNIWTNYLTHLEKNPTFKHPLIQDHLKAISDEFAKKISNENEYKISCALFNRMMEEKKANVGGILYPSVEYEKNDLNIVLIPEFVDNYLILSRVDEYKISINENGGEFIQIGTTDCMNFNIKRYSLK